VRALQVAAWLTDAAVSFTRAFPSRTAREPEGSPCPSAVLAMLLSIVRKQLLPVLAVCALHSARASTNVDGAVAATLSEHGGVGLAAWSVEGRTGAMCMDGVAGVSVSGQSTPLVLEGDARYHIGSDTKSMTATLVAILIENGDISGWDATLGSLLPNTAPGTPYEEVTLKQLVSSLSGLPANPTGLYRTYQGAGDIKAQRAACAAEALATAPEADPGTSFIYSNWGFVVVGHVLEVLTGRSWEALLRERLFAPLGIALDADASSFTGAPDTPLGHDDAHTPCDPATTAWGCDNDPVLGPAGTFSGPVAATSAYFAWHLRCHNGEFMVNETSPLPQAACVAMHQPADPSIGDYGFGWFCTSRDWAGGDSGLVCSHTGSNTLNYFVAWLGFGIDRAFMSFANSPDAPNGAMTDAAVGHLIQSQGSEDCAARIESSVYGTTTENPGPAPDDTTTENPSPAPNDTTAPGTSSTSGAKLETMLLGVGATFLVTILTL
jgi:D-alanyl-D-alanine carboxypeptidase